MHVGIIPDGNRRYMKKTGIVDLEQAYRLGIDCFYNTIEWCDDLGIDEVTIYTLSLENPLQEVHHRPRLPFSIA